MHLLIRLSVFFSLTSSIMAGMTSPDGRYKVEYRKNSFVTEAVFMETKNNTILHVSMTSEFMSEPYQEVSWSPDSKHLVVIGRGTKTTAHLKIYEFSEDTVTRLVTPAFRLNLLGRHKLVEGGRYNFVKNIQWVKGGIQVAAFGSLVDGASNPKDDRKNWYFYDVMIEVDGRRAELKRVKKSAP